MVERGGGNARFPRALHDLARQGADAHHRVHAPGEGTAPLAVERRSGRPELQHVAEHGDAPPGGEEGERHDRGLEGLGRGVVAVVEQHDALAEPTHFAPVGRGAERGRGLGHGLQRDAEHVRGGGGGEEARHEVRPRERQRDVDGPAGDAQEKRMPTPDPREARVALSHDLSS